MFITILLSTLLLYQRLFFINYKKWASTSHLQI